MTYKYTITQSMKVVANGNSQAEKTACYLYLKSECIRAYGAENIVTPDDAKLTVTVSKTWQGEQ